MHGLEEFGAPKNLEDNGRPWYSEMTRYHWFVLIVAALGWLFDCLDQQLFTLARPKAMEDLLGVTPDSPLIGGWGGYATSVFIIGWATGGLLFGALGDRIGRAKTMMITILIYSFCTGLSSFSFNFWDFAVYRFLTGLGVGGEFAVGVALVAEVMPGRARPYALATLQALSAFGNITAALVGIFLAPYEEQGISAWRVMFIIGALPALLALAIRGRLKEPERWQAAVASGKKAAGGTYAEMFGDPRWRKNAIIGLLLAIPGVVGLWGIAFFSGDLARQVFRDDLTPPIFERYREEASADAQKLAVVEQLAAWEKKAPKKEERAAYIESLSAEENEFRIQVGRSISSKLTVWQSMTLLTQNVGAFFGMYGFGLVTQRIGRRPTFLISFIGAMLTTAAVFWYLDEPGHVFWMIPIMGFFQLSLFAGYAIYFPELFPTRLRSTGTSFCYNVGRFVAASGPMLLGLMVKVVYAPEHYPAPLNWRYAGVTMCAIFVIGMITLIFAPETKGQPLPE